LIDNRIDGNGGLAGLPVADDQLTLSAANGDHGVDGLNASLQGFAHRLTCVDAWATTSIRDESVDLIEPLPSIGWPIAFTTRPIKASRLESPQYVRALDRIAFLDPDVIAH